jgi:epoxyqueuosine reductase QueG
LREAVLEHPILSAVQHEGFEPLGWFAAGPGDALPGDARFLLLIGNAGPIMFNRFARERDAASGGLDDWTRETIDALAKRLEATAVYPFDKPPPPFLTWARRAGAGHVSPLGLNIHPVFGLWHAYRAALLFSVAFDLPEQHAGNHPCESCADHPCLSACPVNAFSGHEYRVETCVDHISTQAGKECMTAGCIARRACPVGRRFVYGPRQSQFHMRAFLRAQRKKHGQGGPDQSDSGQ